MCKGQNSFSDKPTAEEIDHEIVDGELPDAWRAFFWELQSALCHRNPKRFTPMKRIHCFDAFGRKPLPATRRQKRLQRLQRCRMMVITCSKTQRSRQFLRLLFVMCWGAGATYIKYPRLFFGEWHVLSRVKAHPRQRSRRLSSSEIPSIFDNYAEGLGFQADKSCRQWLISRAPTSCRTDRQGEISTPVAEAKRHVKGKLKPKL